MSTPILRVTKGKALIICNAKFIRDEDLLGYRKDAVDMKAALTALRFDVDVIHDLKAAEMRAALSTVAKLEYSDYDAVMVIVCTHGGQDGVRTDGGRFAQLVGTDGVTIPFDTVYDLFGGNESLKGKPKIFLIQACRGLRGLPFPAASAVSASPVRLPVPVVAGPPLFRASTADSDFMLVYASATGFVSWVDQSTGSFFLQVVVSQLRSNSESFNDMMTGVAASVSEMMIDGEVAQTVNASSSLRCKLVLQFAVPAPVALPADTEALALLQCLGKSPRPSVADMKFIVKHVQPVLSSLAVAASFSTFVFGLVQTYDETSAANRVTCSEAGVIETVIAAISAHGAISGGFVVFACGTLGNLAKGTPANADKIVEAGGLDVISAMMIAYPTSLSVQLGCCQSVGCLAEASPAAAAIIAQDERVVTLLRAARSNHPSEPAGEGKEAKCNVKWLVTATLRILGVPE